MAQFQGVRQNTQGLSQEKQQKCHRDCWKQPRGHLLEGHRVGSQHDYRNRAGSEVREDSISVRSWHVSFQDWFWLGWVLSIPIYDFSIHQGKALFSIPGTKSLGHLTLSHPMELDFGVCSDLGMWVTVKHGAGFSCHSQDSIHRGSEQRVQSERNCRPDSKSWDTTHDYEVVMIAIPQHPWQCVSGMPQLSKSKDAQVPCGNQLSVCEPPAYTISYTLKPLAITCNM